MIVLDRLRNVCFLKLLIIYRQVNKYLYHYSETNGYCKVFKDGSNLWVTDKESKHEYVKLREGANFEEIARLMDNMVIKK